MTAFDRGRGPPGSEASRPIQGAVVDRLVQIEAALK
jgi:hypothetical protein